jgi:hypothetical protein
MLGATLGAPVPHPPPIPDPPFPRVSSPPWLTSSTSLIHQLPSHLGDVLRPQPSTLNPQPSTLKVARQLVNDQRANPEPSTPNAKP